MDDVDAFLASLDRFTSPSIDAGIQRQQLPRASASATGHQQPQQHRHDGTAAVSSTSQPSQQRRRQRGDDDTQSLQPAVRQRRRFHSGGNATARHETNTFELSSSLSSSSDGSSVSELPVSWQCLRCSTMNSDRMQSCAVCHRRRQLVESRQPTVVAADRYAPPAAVSAPSFSSVGSGAPPLLASASSHGAVQQGRERRGLEESFGSVVKRGGGYPIGRQGAVDDAVVAVEVACPRCTFLNPAARRTCEMCEGPLPAAPAQVSEARVPPLAASTCSPGIHGFMPSAAAAAVVPSVSLPGLAGRSSSPPPQPPAGASGLAAATHRPVVLQEATRETLSISPVAIAAKSSSSSSSGEEDDHSSDDDASSHDSDWDGQPEDPLAPVDHRELVRFLETLQSVRFDDLPCAAPPASMAARAELRPFQLQALYWLLTREHQQPKTLQQDMAEDDFFLLGGGTDKGSGGAAADHEKLPSFSSTSGGAAVASVPLPGKDRSAFAPRTQAGSTHSGSPSFSSPAGNGGEKGDSVRGGVFADFMGLGKTRTLIALCESARAPRLDRVTGSLVESTATLIVCPTSLLTQWVEEIRRCVERPASAPLRILVYYGARKRRQTLFQVAQSYDYVLTTYQTLTHEQQPLSLAQTSSIAGRLERSRNGHSFGGGGGDGGFCDMVDPYDLLDDTVDDSADAYDVDRSLQAEVGKLFMIRWARIILDEAHCIRNMRTRQSRACLKLTGVCRWAVTATPVQNTLNDFYPLLRFLAVPHFSSLTWWNNEIVRHFNQDPQHPRVVTALSILFRSILLRRTPDSLVKGRPILNLPPKRVVTHTVALSREETQYYKAIHSSATQKLNAVRQGDAAAMARSPLATFTTAFEMLVRCRQTCLHPYIVVAALRRCQRLPANTSGAAAGMPSTAAQKGTTAITGDAARLAARRREEQQEVEEREKEAARQRSAVALDHFVQSVVLRRLRTVKASEFVQSLVAEIKAQKLESRECIICLDTVNRPAILPCAHVFCEECITHALEATRRCPLCKRNSKQSELLLVPVELLDPAQHATAGSAVKPESASGAGAAGDADVGAPPEVPLDMDLMNVSNWGLQLSSKTQYLIDSIRSLPVDDKVVIFSSFLTYLRYAQHYLEAAGITCVIFSGGMTMKQKQQLLAKFADAAAADSPRVLLATISSCGVGLNLTCANHCFLMEPSWNPGIEEQALNRIHRIGQVKPVTVTKLIADGTIEQSISQLCERKRALSGYCFGGGGGGGDGRLRTADLLALFAPESDSNEESDDDDDEEEEDSGDDTE